jgi:hypothetical protein
VNGSAALTRIALSALLLTVIPLVSAGAQEVAPPSWGGLSPASHATVPGLFDNPRVAPGPNQAMDSADQVEGSPFIRTASMATAGSMTGFVAGGAVAAGATCLGGCDWGELVLAAYLGALGGATLLSAAGAHLASPSDRSFARGPLLGATLGIAPGILGFIVASALEDGVQVSWVTVAGFAVGQGLTTAWVATRR